jgi:hypothetical protein
MAGSKVFEKGLLQVVTLDDARCNACSRVRLSIVLTGPNGHVTYCSECAQELAQRCEAIGLQVKTTVATAIQRAMRREG